MPQMKSFWILLVLGAVIFTGCGKRNNPASPGTPSGGIVVSQAPFFTNTLDTANNALIFNNLRPESPFRRIRVYLPPGYQPRGQGRPFPTLYLLHDFGIYPDVSGSASGGDDSYFGFYELAQVMDRLIAKGEIKPMIVVQTDMSNFYGGSFYTNSTCTARFFTAVDSFLVNYVDRTYNTVFGRRSRAISGHGMGGYGALRMVLAGDDSTFGSVSALSAPLAFGDAGSGQGFQSQFYIDGLFTEGDTVIPRGDSALFRRDSAAVLFPDPRLAQKIRTNMLFAMGAAFSPVGDTARFKRALERGQRDSLLAADPDYFQFSKSPKDAGFLFPIDWNGHIIDSVWGRWLANDIKTMLSNPAKAGRLDTTPLFFSCGIDDQLGMLEQNRTFRTALVGAGFSPVTALTGWNRGQFLNKFYYEEYDGYPGRPADHTSFITDELVKVLKFHSQFLDTAAVP